MNITIKQPMKGDDAVLDQLKFPYMLTPKLDGMRCAVVNNKPLTSSMKPVTNLHIAKLLSNPLFNGFDGELISGSPTAEDVFTRTMGDCRRSTGEPDFGYYVFDLICNGAANERYARLIQAVRGTPDFIKLVEPILCTSRDHLDAHLEMFLEQGYEGVMLRSLGSPYKAGRSTVKENFLLKVKPFEDAEAVVVGMVEAQTNTNPKVTNELGRGQRSSAQAGKVAKGTMGALKVRAVNGRYAGVEFEIGTGFKDADRAHAWNQADALLGQYLTFKCQTVGNYAKPRLPVFKGYRELGTFDITE